MAFWLKKIVARFLFPVPLVLELAMLGWLLLRWQRTRGWGKALIALSFFLLCGLSMPITGKALLGSLENRYPPLDSTCLFASIHQAENQPVVIVVAGNGFARLNGSSSVYGFNDSFLVRLQEAGRIANALSAAGRPYQVVVSVASLHVPDAVKRAELIRFFDVFGIPPERIALVSSARNSAEEVEAFCRFPGQLIMVSQAFHLPRLMALMAEQGRDAIPAPAGRRVLGTADSFHGLDFIPSAEALDMTRTAFYEHLGMFEILFR